MAARGPECESGHTGISPPAPRPATRRRRKFDRQPISAAVTVTEVDHQGGIGASWPCQTVDISRGGLGVKSRRMVHIGRGLLVEIHGGASAADRVLFGIVRRACYNPGEGYVIGIQFQAPPGYSPVHRWLKARGGLEPSRVAGPGAAE